MRKHVRARQPAHQRRHSHTPAARTLAAEELGEVNDANVQRGSRSTRPARQSRGEQAMGHGVGDQHRQGNPSGAEAADWEPLRRLSRRPMAAVAPPAARPAQPQAPDDEWRPVRTHGTDPVTLPALPNHQPWDRTGRRGTSAMAQQLPGTETEAYMRFKALRDSGYTGPIDQDGNQVTSGKAAEILTDMRKVTEIAKRRSKS